METSKNVFMANSNISIKLILNYIKSKRITKTYIVLHKIIFLISETIWRYNSMNFII